MTPIPPDVAALIGATGHYIEATVTASPGTNRAAWIWSSRGLVESPSWRVDIGDGYGRGATARAATLDALAKLAASEAKREKEYRDEAKRVRLDYRKAQATCAPSQRMWPRCGRR